MTEYVTIMAFSISALLLYNMYRFFNTAIHDSYLELISYVEGVVECIHKNRRQENALINDKIKLIEHTHKDAIQNLSICCKSGIHSIKHDIGKIFTRLIALENNSKESRKKARKIEEEQSLLSKEQNGKDAPCTSKKPTTNGDAKTSCKTTQP